MNNEDTNTGTTSETSSFSVDSWLKMKTLIVMFAVIAVTFFIILYAFTVTYTDILAIVQIKEYIVLSY